MMMCLLPVVPKNSAMHRMTFLWMKVVMLNTHCSSICSYLTSIHLLVIGKSAACFCSFLYDPVHGIHHPLVQSVDIIIGQTLAGIAHFKTDGLLHSTIIFTLMTKSGTIYPLNLFNFQSD